MYPQLYFYLWARKKQHVRGILTPTKRQLTLLTRSARPTNAKQSDRRAHHGSRRIQVYQLRYLLFSYLRRFKFAGTQIQCVGLTTLPPSCADCLEILGPSTSWNPQGLSMPVKGLLYPLNDKFGWFLHYEIHICCGVGMWRRSNSVRLLIPHAHSIHVDIILPSAPRSH